MTKNRPSTVEWKPEELNRIFFAKWEFFFILAIIRKTKIALADLPFQHLTMTDVHLQLVARKVKRATKFLRHRSSNNIRFAQTLSVFRSWRLWGWNYDYYSSTGNSCEDSYRCHALCHLSKTDVTQRECHQLRPRQHHIWTNFCEPQ